MKQQWLLLLAAVGMSLGVMATPDCSGVTDPCASCYPYLVKYPSISMKSSAVNMAITASEQTTLSVADMDEGPCSSSMLSGACDLGYPMEESLNGITIQSEGPNDDSPLYGCGVNPVYAVTSDLCENNTGCYCCVQAYDN